MKVLVPPFATVCSGSDEWLLRADSDPWPNGRKWENSGRRMLPRKARSRRPEREFQPANGPATTDTERRFARTEAAEGETIRSVGWRGPP